MSPNRTCLSDTLYMLDGRIAPEAFQVVVRPLVLGEDVDDDVPKIEEHPAAAASAFGADRRLAGLAERLLHAFRDGLELAVVGSRADDEEVGVARVLAQVDEHDVSRLLLERRRGGAPRRRFRIARARPRARRLPPGVVQPGQG